MTTVQVSSLRTWLSLLLTALGALAGVVVAD